MDQIHETTFNGLFYGNDCPYIDLQWKTGKLFISNATLRLINRPSGIRILWNEETFTIIIEPTIIEDPNGFPVIGKYYSKRGSLSVGSVTLINKIWESTNWDKSLRYRAVAKYNETSNIAIFEMKEAIASEIPRNLRGRGQKQIDNEQNSEIDAINNNLFGVCEGG